MPMRLSSLLPIGCLVLGCSLGSAWAAAANPDPAPTPSPRSAMPRDMPRPLRVGVSLIVNSVSQPDEATGHFEASVDLQLRWRDPNQAFDAKEIGIDRLEFGYEKAVAKLATMWTPTIVFANMPDKAYKPEPGLFINSDGTVVYIQRISGVFKTKFKLAAFPFDTQSLIMQLQDPRENVNEIIFVQDQQDMDNSGILPSVTLSGWHLQRLDCTISRFRGWDGDLYPQMTAAVRMQRVPTTHVPSILIPFLLIMLVPTAMSLYADADLVSRLAAWGGAILALVALNFTFSVRYPALGAETCVGELIAMGFAYQLLMIFLTLTVFNPPLTPSLGGQHVIAELTNFLRWSLPLVFLGLIVILIVLTAYST